MEIRDATGADWDAIWPFFHEIAVAGETYAYDPEIAEVPARAMWIVRPARRTVVAVEDGAVAGSANMYANRAGPGSHVASASFMVDPRRFGRGIGRALGEHVLAWARDAGRISPPGRPLRGLARDAPQSRVDGAGTGWVNRQTCCHARALPAQTTASRLRDQPAVTLAPP